jgi:hypothetical protein
LAITLAGLETHAVVDGLCDLLLVVDEPPLELDGGELQATSNRTATNETGRTLAPRHPLEPCVPVMLGDLRFVSRRVARFRFVNGPPDWDATQ